MKLNTGFAGSAAVIASVAAGWCPAAGAQGVNWFDTGSAMKRALGGVDRAAQETLVAHDKAAQAALDETDKANRAAMQSATDNAANAAERALGDARSTARAILQGHDKAAQSFLETLVTANRAAMQSATDNAANAAEDASGTVQDAARTALQEHDKAARAVLANLGGTGPMAGTVSDAESAARQIAQRVVDEWRQENPDWADAKPLPGKVPNGCGGEGTEQMIVSLLNLALDKEACDAHDLGYATPGRPRTVSDAQFYLDLLDRDVAPGSALAAYAAVTLGGGSYYSAAQTADKSARNP